MWDAAAFENCTAPLGWNGGVLASPHDVGLLLRTLAMTLSSLPFTDAAAGVTVRRATESDTPGIVDAWYSSMMPDEPMTEVLTQGKGPERCEALTSHVEHCLEEGVSVVAVDVNTGAVAGAL
jgi:hypothetical protein